MERLIINLSFQTSIISTNDIANEFSPIYIVVIQMHYPVYDGYPRKIKSLYQSTAVYYQYLHKDWINRMDAQLNCEWL